MLERKQNISKYELYLNEILRAIESIETSLKNKNFKEFIEMPDLIDSNSMRLQVIGESITKLPESFKEKRKDINWDRFIQTRKIISHAYSSVNKKILWDIIKKDIPILKKQIEELKYEK